MQVQPNVLEDGTGETCINVSDYEVDELHAFSATEVPEIIRGSAPVMIFMQTCALPLVNNSLSNDDT